MWTAMALHRNEPIRSRRKLIGGLKMYYSDDPIRDFERKEKIKDG
nr:MAG TPA: hypothetical protein [Caudoviricetes sp.]